MGCERRIREEQTEEQQKEAAASAQLYMLYMSPTDLIRGFSRYNQIIRRVAGENDIILIEDENVISGDAVHFNDSVHFTDAGSRVMAERIVRVLATHPRIQDLATTTTMIDH